MKYAQILLIFSVITRWCFGEQSAEGSVNQQLLQEIEMVMNIEFRPCSEFYKFACDKYGYYYDSTAISRIHHEAEEDIGYYLNNTSMEDKPEFVRKAHAFYSSCLKTNNKSNAQAYIQWMRKHENFSWALYPTSKDEDARHDWIHTLAIMRKYGMRYIFLQEMPYVEKIDTRKIELSFDRPSSHFTIFHEEDILSDEFFELRSFGNLWEKVTDLDDKLNALCSSYEGEPEEKLYAVKDLPFRWLKKYIHIILDGLIVDEDMQISMKNIAYLEALADFLKIRGKRLIGSYLEFRFFAYLYDIYEGRTCVQLTRNLMPEAANWIYEQIHPELQQAFAEANEMFESFKSQIKSTLHGKNKSAIPETFFANLETMKLQVSNIPPIDTVKSLNAFYDNLNLNSSDFHGNLLQILKFHFNGSHTTTGKEFGFVQKFEAYLARSPAVPYYDAPSNVVVIPTEFLRPPYYHADYSDVFKYSALGRLLSHYIYESLNVEDLEKSDITELAITGSIQTAYQVFFSALSVDATNENYTINGRNISTKQWFFLNAAHDFCKCERLRFQDHLLERIALLPEFEEAFDCKLYSMLKVFAPKTIGNN